VRLSDVYSGDSAANRDIIWALADDTVGTACTRMAEHLIRSMPVFSHVVTYTKSHQTRIILTDGQDFVADVGVQPVMSVVDLSHRNPTVSMPASSTLLEALEGFVRRSPRPRQIIVTKHLMTTSEITLKDVVGILPPSLLLRVIHDGAKAHGHVISAPFTSAVSYLNLGSAPVITVNKTLTVLEAMDTMYHAGITGVGVVDDHNALVGNISMSDVRHVFKKKRFSTLINSCWQFIVEMRAESMDETFPIYGVRETALLTDVTSKVLATHVHHLFVVDGKMCPMRIISLCDILTAIGGD